MTLEITELTPPGSGAVTVLRLTGTDAPNALMSVATGRVPDIGSFAWTRLRIGAELLDEALLCATSPGEFELHVHGSTALVRRLREHWTAFARRLPETDIGAAAGAHIGAGSRLGAVAGSRLGDAAGASSGATAGPIEARALALAAHAPSEAGARILVDQANGALRVALGALRDLAPGPRGALALDLLERGRVARFTLHPTRVVLAGPVNAGKSTLFNVLVGERRVVVSDHPGTTRDVVRAEALLGAYPVMLSDTAGSRSVPGSSAVDELERAAQVNAELERRDADLVLWLQAVDDARELPSEPGSTRQAHACLRSCADRVEARIQSEARETGATWISARVQPEDARSIVERVFQERFELPMNPWVEGLAVPFETDQMALLARVAGSPSEAVGEALARMLCDHCEPHANDVSVAPHGRVH